MSDGESQDTPTPTTPGKFTKTNHHGLQRIRRAFRFSWQGFVAAWRYETAFREEVVVVAALCPLAFWVGQSPTQTALLIFASLQVLLVELMNSAVEAAVDRVSNELHPLAGRAKDLGSAAVLVSIVLAAAVWALLLWQKFS